MLQMINRVHPLTSEILTHEGMQALLPAWQALCERSVEDNVYYSPRYASALLETVELDANVRFAVVREGERLMALLPFSTCKFALPRLQPGASAWESKYTFSCTPLLDKERPRQAAAALLNVLAFVNEGEWILPAVNTAGAACRSLLAAIEERGAQWLILNQFERAKLESGCTFDEHMKCNVSSKRRRELARNRRGLEALGMVRHEVHCSGEGLERAIAAFLEMEARGWKGKRGTALACDDQTRQFALRAFTGESTNSICRADVLNLSGQPIAVSLTAFANRTGFTVKCTYDEDYRRYSAGLLLEVEVIRSFLEEKWARHLDSATAGAHVIDALWPGRTEVGDLMFSLSPRYSLTRLSALKTADQARQSTKITLKRYLNYVRPTWQRSAAVMAGRG